MTVRNGSRPNGLGRITALGLTGSTLAVLGGWLSGASGATTGIMWTVPTVHTRPVITAFWATTIFWAGLLLLVRFWLRLRRAGRLGQLSTWRVLAIVGPVALPLLLGPPLASRDVYAYVAQGQIAAAGGNPYVTVPSRLGTSIVAAVDVPWRDVPAPYGPTFLVMSEHMVNAAGGAIIQTIFGFRLLALAGLALAALAIPALARAQGTDPVDALVLVLANPITLLHLVSGAHNEAIMIGLLLAGLAIGRRNVVAGVLLCSLAASVKVPAVLGALYLGWSWASNGRNRPRRAGRLAAVVAMPPATMAVIGHLTGWGWGWLPPVMANRTIATSVSLSTSLGELFARIAASVVPSLAALDIIETTRRIGLIAAVVLIAYWFLHHRTFGMTALGWSLVALALLSPATQPWYLLWGLAVIACTPAGRTHSWLLALSAGLLLIALPSGPRLDHVLFAHHPVVVVLAAAVLLLPLTFRPTASSRQPDTAGRVGPGPRDVGSVSLIIPTKNEGDNIVELLQRLNASLAAISHDTIVVDDGDDDLLVRVEQLPAELRREVTVWRREQGRRWGGLAGAVLDGMQHAQGEIVVVMDGDLQHPPEDVAALVCSIRDGAELAVATRSIGGAHLAGLSDRRWAASRLATVAVHATFPRHLRSLRDPLSGFFAVQRSALDTTRLAPDGFKILLEIVATHRLRTVQVNFTFARRHAGRSKAGFTEARRLLTQLCILRIRAWVPWQGWTPARARPPVRTVARIGSSPSSN